MTPPLPALLAVLAAAAVIQRAPDVELVSPGVLSSGQVYRGTFSSDGRTLYFFKKTGDGETYRIFSAQRTAEGWSTPTVVDLGGAYSDLYPAISPDGRRLVFSSYRRVPGQSTIKPNAHLWYAERAGKGWGSPAYLARVSTPGHYHSWVEFGFDGALYFRRTTPDWKENVTMRSAWDGREFAAPAPYEDVERWKQWRSDVRIVGGSPGPRGQLVFLDVATTNPGTGRGASDIWVAVRHREGWGEPKPLGASINSDGFDVFPFVSPDERDLYFVRDFATFHRVPLAVALASINASPEIRYVANSGMLVITSGVRLLIDAPTREGIPPYATSSADERARLEQARPPYDAVDAILVTHWHEDHFSAEAIAAHLTANQKAIVISSPEVVDRIRKAAPAVAGARLRAVLPQPGRSEPVDVAGVPVHVLRIRHNPARRLPEQHVGFLIAGPAPLLHVGDADPQADNFAVLRQLPEVDVAFLPFWYVSDASNRSMVATAIRPRRTVAMHIPPGDVPAISDALRKDAPNVEVAGVPGTTIVVR